MCESNNILYQAASVWNKLTDYCYVFTYGYKNQLYTINLSFSMEDFPHLAGFQYLKDISLPSMPDKYPFATAIKADYLISCHLDLVSFVFIIQNTSDGKAKCDYLCCSAFTKGERDYEANQRRRVLLKKERIHIPTNSTTVLFDRLGF